MEQSWSPYFSEESSYRHIQTSKCRSYVIHPLIQKSFGIQVSNQIEGQPIEPIQVCNGIYKVMIKDMKIFHKYIFTSLPTSQGEVPPLQQTSLAELLYKTSGNARYTFDRSKYIKCIGQAITILKQKMESHWIKISSSQPNFYNDLYKKNTELLTASKHELKHTKEDNIPKRLYALDIFVLFLKQNRILRDMCQYPALAGIIKKQNIKAIFGIQDLQYYEDKLAKSQNWLKFDQLADYQQILMLLSVVELRYRVFNYKSRTKDADKILNKFVSLPFTNVKEYFKYFKDKQDEEDDNFKFKFSELVCFGQGDLFSTKSVLIRPQIVDQLSKTANQVDFSQRRKMFLDIKIKYRVTLDSLYEEYENVKNNKEKGEFQRHKLEQKMKQDLDNAEWIHLLTNRFPKTLEITIAYSNQFMYKNKFFSTLFEKSEKRFKLLQQVVSVQIALEEKVGRRTIYVSRFEYSYDQLAHFKSRSNSKTANSLTQETGITAYITLGTDSERVLFTSISSQATQSFDYDLILKNYFTKEGIKHATLVLSQISYKKTMYWLNYLRICNYFKEHHDTHVYIDNSIKLFTPHQKLYYIIKAYLLDYSFLNPKRFLRQVERNTQEIVLLLGAKIIEGCQGKNREIQKITAFQAALDDKMMISSDEIEHIGKVLLQIFSTDPTQVKYEVLSCRQRIVCKFYKYSKEDIMNKQAQYASSKRQITGQNANLKDCIVQFTSEYQKRMYSKADLPNQTDQNVIIAKVLQKRGMRVRLIKYILKNVTKLLLIYELFLKILLQEAAKLKIGLETAWLQAVYHEEQLQIIKIFTEKTKVVRKVVTISHSVLCKDFSTIIEKDGEMQDVALMKEVTQKEN